MNDSFVEESKKSMTDFDEMMQLLETAWCMRRQIVPCLVGPPGIGKTAAVELHARNHGSNVVKIVASRCVPSETVGMTMPDHRNRSMAIYNSMQLSSLRDGDILFLDELLEADQFVLSTLLTVIESREMADGTPLPDIQIIAATNDTIPPEQRKGNIRQRFMFQRFGIDREQTKSYILDKTGIKVPDHILAMLSDKGNDYNFLTPRSLTKLCEWVDATPADRLCEVASVINKIWRSVIGNDLVHARKERDKKLDTPEQQVRKAVLRIIEEDDTGIREDIPAEFSFDDCTLGELLEMLQGLDEWKEIETRLANMEIKEEQEEEVDITF